jgi:hypothetical protein
MCSTDNRGYVGPPFPVEIHIRSVAAVTVDTAQQSPHAD